MAIQNYIGWPVGVNRIILDATTISVGEGALQQDELESGKKQSQLKSPYVPEKYSVKMSFNWLDPVGTTGKTEYQLFMDWYKYIHKCGVVPFEFPNILYSSETGIKVYDERTESVKNVQYYKITSSIEGTKSGYDVSITMTWEAVYSGAVTITTPTPAILDIEAQKKYLDVNFSDVSTTAPLSSQFTLYKKSNNSDPYEEVAITGYAFDGTSKARLYHAEIQSGKFSVAVNNYAGLNVDVGDYESDIPSI